MNIIILTAADSANAGHCIAAAVNSIGKHSVRVVQGVPNPLGYESDLCICKPVAGRGLPQREVLREVSALMSDVDLIHFKDDIPPQTPWYMARVNQSVPWMVTVEGSTFRNEKYPLTDYTRRTLKQSVLTPDLRFREGAGDWLYMPLTFPVKDTPVTFIAPPPGVKPHLVHAATDAGAKGTFDVVLPAFELLRSKYGLDFTYDIISGATHENSLKRISKATAYINGSCVSGWYGFAAIEAAARGIPVVSWLDDEVAAWLYDDTLPGCKEILVAIQSFDVDEAAAVTVENLASRLHLILVRNRESLPQLSVLTREAFEAYHGYATMGVEWGKLYEFVVAEHAEQQAAARAKSEAQQAARAALPKAQPIDFPQTPDTIAISRAGRGDSGGSNHD